VDAVSKIPTPHNLPPLDYRPGSPERDELEVALRDLTSVVSDIACEAGGVSFQGAGEPRTVVQPHSHSEILARFHKATPHDVEVGVEQALLASHDWRSLSYDDRSSIFLKAADLLSGPWRARMNAATMLGQSKTIVQADIDAACELADFWRFNVSFGRKLLEDQPESSRGVWNRMDYRPLEGFVCAITPFNFTAIAGNLPTAPVLMGNVVLWKPAETQLLSAELTLQILREAGLPPGVISFVAADGDAVSQAAIAHPSLAGIHFTGSTPTFHKLWRIVNHNLENYRSYPRLVGETGGKDFVVAHKSADVEALVVALTRGAFEYQGQKCSAASRAYIPASLWGDVKNSIIDLVKSLKMGDVRDFSNFMSAVIDRRAFDALSKVFDDIRHDPAIDIIVGGTTHGDEGFFVDPTVVVSTDPYHRVFTEEFFGPLLAIYVYPDSSPNAFDDVLGVVDRTSPYGLTGAIFANDRFAVATAVTKLRFAAGNFYINDKPSGSVVGHQPFGGARASGTNDKAGSILNLQRWVSGRSIKENFLPPHSVSYPSQDT
jgi:1-pyrroline-5-carboxylate dehydrogenase